jgi:hypothetical protein
MGKNIVTEIVSFEIINGINDQEFIKIVDFLEKEFHMKQNGYIDTELIKGKDDNQWMMIQHWQTMNDAKESSKQMMKSKFTENFRNSLDPKSVKLSCLEQKYRWII